MNLYLKLSFLAVLAYFIQSKASNINPKKRPNSRLYAELKQINEHTQETHYGRATKRTKLNIQKPSKAPAKRGYECYSRQTGAAASARSVYPTPDQNPAQLALAYKNAAAQRLSAVAKAHQPAKQATIAFTPTASCPTPYHQFGSQKLETTHASAASVYPQPGQTQTTGTSTQAVIQKPTDQLSAGLTTLGATSLPPIDDIAQLTGSISNLKVSEEEQARAVLEKLKNESANIDQSQATLFSPASAEDNCALPSFSNN